MKRELWADYRRTSNEYARKLNEMQELAASGPPGPESVAKLQDLRKTRIAHDAARHRLAQYLSAQTTGKNEEQSIRKTARLIWEFSGKPQNSAESDWYRAEELVRSA